MPAKKKHIYKVIFHSQGKLYELHATELSQGGMFGFIEVEELVFGERAGVARALITLESRRVDVSGLNCSTGPEHRREPVRYLTAHAKVPISCIPNAGLPLNTGTGDAVNARILTRGATFSYCSASHTYEYSPDA